MALKIDGTLRRFFYRIFLPLLFVVIFGTVARCIMIRDFNEQRVERAPTDGAASVSDQPMPWEDMAQTRAFSEETRERLVATLEEAKRRLDELAAETRGDATGEARSMVASAETRAEVAIRLLDTADEASWSERQEDAAAAMAAYAEAVGQVAPDEGGGPRRR